MLSGGLLAMMGILGVSGFVGINHLAGDVARIGHERLEVARNMTLVDILHDGLRAVVYRSVVVGASGTEVQRREIAAQARKFADDITRQLGAIRRMSLPDETKQAVSDARLPLEAYKGTAVRITELALAGRGAEARAALPQLEASFERLDNSLFRLGDLIEADAAAAVADGQAAADRFRWIMGFLVLAGLGFGGAHAARTTQHITRPIQSAETALRGLAAGDVAVRMPGGSGDELGRMADSFNGAMDKLQAILHQVQETAQQLAAQAQQMSATSEQTSLSVDEIARAVHGVAAGAELQVKTSAAAASAAEQGSRQVEEAVRSMEAICSVSSRTAAVVNTLGERSRNIGQIVRVITQIASQTNLLALNAAIEAARAGEQGRGFAVVAEEVRKLAQESAQAADQIAELVRDVQGEADRAVETIARSGDEVKHGVAVMAETGDAFRRIVRAVQEIASASQQNSASAQQVSAGTEEITASAHEVSGGAAALARVAEDLQHIVSQFRL